MIVITSRFHYHGGQMLPAQETLNGVDVRRVWTLGLGRSNLALRALEFLTFYVSAFVCLIVTLRRGDVALVKTDPPLIAVPALLAARLKGARHINWTQDLFPETAEALGVSRAGGGLGAMLRSLRNLTLRSADLNAVLDPAMANRVRACGVPDAKIIILENWADVRIRTVPHAHSALRQRLGLDGKFVIGYSGNLGRAHLPDEVGRLVLMTQAMPNLVWLFIGGGVGMQALKARFIHAPNVHFLPYQPQDHLSESLSAPDVHLVTLDPACEGLVFPSKLYGVASAGRPVIFLGDATGSIGSLLPQSFVLPAAEPQHWAAKIERFQDEWRRTGEVQCGATVFARSTEQALQAWSAAIDCVLAKVEPTAQSIPDPQSSLGDVRA